MRAQVLPEAQLPFTTAFHTRFPEYVRTTGLPLWLGYAWMRRFHEPPRTAMVATPTLRQELQPVRLPQPGALVPGRGHRPVPPAGRRPPSTCPGRFSFASGRVAVEKNIEAFLGLDLPGSKVVVGDGPDLAKLRARHPDVLFLGAKYGEDLARHYAAADVFVFPSRTDTFGLVLLEAMASGLPVAAYPVTGPLDVVVKGVTGFLDEDLGRAAKAAVALSPQVCREHAMGYSWRACAVQFLSHVTPLPAGLRRALRTQSVKGAREPGDPGSAHKLMNEIHRVDEKNEFSSGYKSV